MDKVWIMLSIMAILTLSGGILYTRSMIVGPLLILFAMLLFIGCVIYGIYVTDEYDVF